MLKAKLRRQFIVLALIAGITQATAQQSRFFRVSGPTNTTIIAFNPDGTLVWSNAQPGATYTVQTVALLPGGSNWLDYVQLPTTNAVNTNFLIDFNPPPGMTLIPAGTFTMGDTLDGEPDAVPVTNVYVSAFYMDVNLVSYSHWQSVYNWASNQGYSFYNTDLGKATNQPVQTVYWFDAVKWCNARSQQVGLTPVYYADAGLTQVFTSGDGTPFVNWAASGYRLPTEAEWEKAARGGLSGQRFPWGNVISENLANYLPNTNYSYDLGPNNDTFNPAFTNGGRPYTSPVGYFAANGYGLRDMAGNVVEWCWDWYGTPYGQPTNTNPTGPAFGIYRVFRGGSWDGDAFDARCAERTYNVPDFALNIIGFRCVRGH